MSIMRCRWCYRLITHIELDAINLQGNRDDAVIILHGLLLITRYDAYF